MTVSATTQANSPITTAEPTAVHRPKAQPPVIVDRPNASSAASSGENAVRESKSTEETAGKLDVTA
jgi:hypothetical protein